jgi:hypothetical protein
MELFVIAGKLTVIAILALAAKRGYDYWKRPEGKVLMVEGVIGIGACAASLIPH